MNNEGKFKIEGSGKVGTTAKITPFPKMVEVPPHMNNCTPLGILTKQLLLLIELATGKLFSDAMPLVGGPDADKEMARWTAKMKREFSEKNKGTLDVGYEEPIPLSGYLTTSLMALQFGTAATMHIMASAADSTKALYELSSFYQKFEPQLVEIARITRSKDITDSEKLDTLIAFIYAVIDEWKNTILDNSKKCPEALAHVISDVNQAFFHLENISKGSKLLNINETKNNNNSDTIDP